MLLYPRLSPQQGKQLAELRSTQTLLELSKIADVSHPNVTYAPTGGTRVTTAQLAKLQESIRDTAKEHGFDTGLAGGEPLPLNAEQKGAFDAALAVTMHKHMGVNAAEASRPGVWRFIGTVLAPAPIRWRFPGEKTTHERFLGNRLRNMYGRVWWRAHLLQDETNVDPYWLLRELGEDELVQITERPNAAGYPPVAVGIARGLVQRWTANLGVSRSGLLREAMKRLLRLLPLVRFEALSIEQVTEEINLLYDETLLGLGIAVEPQFNAIPVIWPADAQWQDLALARRARFLKAVTDDDIARLSSLNNVNLPDWGEYKPRWKALFRIDATAGQVLEIAQEPEGLPRSDELGVWLTQEPAGSWQTDVDPARGKRLLGALRESDLQAIFSTLGWDWPDGMTHSGSQRYMRRRYSGSWQALVHAMPDETMAHITQFLRLADSTNDSVEPHLSLARWLTVNPELALNELNEDPSRASIAVTNINSFGDEHSVAPTVPDSSKLNANVPTLNGELVEVLEQVGVGTVQELMALDIDELALSKRINAGEADKVRELRQDVLATMMGAIPLRTLDPPAADVDRELPPPPSLITKLLRKLEVRTYGALFGLDLLEVGAMTGVGAKKVKAIRAFQKELLAANGERNEAPNVRPPESLDALVSRMLDELNGRESTAVSMRFEHGATLAKIGDALGVSRERARQITREAIRRLYVSYGPQARRLLEEASPGQNGLAYDCSVIGVEAWQALFLATVAYKTDWVYSPPLLWRGKRSSLEALQTRINDTIEKTRLDDATLQQLSQNLDVPMPLLLLLLTKCMGWKECHNGLVLPNGEMPLDQWLLNRLKDAGPTHQNVISKWLMERDKLSAEEQTKNSGHFIRKAERILSRLDDAWRWDRGTFIHTAGIPVSQTELRAMVAWCIDHIAGQTVACDVTELLVNLEAAGFATASLNRYLLKDALVRDEAVNALRKGKVACAYAYNGHG